MKVVFIGGGNMALALVSGLLEQGAKPADLSVVDISVEARQKFEVMGLSVSSTLSDVNFVPDVVILAVKPQQLKEAIHSHASNLKNSLIISIVAGIPVASISDWLDDHERIVRVMPNTPALIRAGVSGMYNGSKTIGDRVLAEAVVGSVGQYVWCETESLIDAVTAVSGSGPAYVFYFIEALEAAALELGLTKDAARLLSLETFLGASRLAARSEEPPSVLRNRVTSKGGTTAAALDSFEVDQLKEIIVKGVKRANSRSTELARDYGGKKV